MKGLECIFTFFVDSVSSSSASMFYCHRNLPSSNRSYQPRCYKISFLIQFFYPGHSLWVVSKVSFGHCYIGRCKPGGLDRADTAENPVEGTAAQTWPKRALPQSPYLPSNCVSWSYSPFPKGRFWAARSHWKMHLPCRIHPLENNTGLMLRRWPG